MPLRDYERPSEPKEETLHRLTKRMYGVFKKTKDPPKTVNDQLRNVPPEALGHAGTVPPCEPLIRDLATDVSEWLRRGASGKIRTVVVPACDYNSVVGSIAEAPGFQLLDPPPRESLTSSAEPIVPTLVGEGPIVIPNLERWFVRHSNGLHTVRALLAELHRQDRPCLVGCSSWAWAYLTKAVAADLVLTHPVTFQAFDARRLHDWLFELASANGLVEKFRLSNSNQAAFSPGMKTSASADYFGRLAARSRGIPWVAWSLWYRSLYLEDESESALEKDLIWLGAADEPTLPITHSQDTLLLLHAVLIHGSVTAETLRSVVPIVGESNLIPALIATGFLETAGEEVRVRAAAYPSVRSALSGAGFPMDSL